MGVVKGEMESEIINIVSTISELDKTKITTDIDLRDDLGIDSMMGLEIMYAVEKRFKIHLREDDLLRMKSVSSICNLVNEQLRQ